MRKALLLAVLAASNALACSSSEEPGGQSGAGSSAMGVAGSAGNPSMSAGSGGGSSQGGSSQGGMSQGGSDVVQGGSGQSSGAGGGGSSSGGATSCGTSPADAAPTPTVCTPAPETFSVNERAALDAVNDLRSKMGLDCMGLVAEISVASQKHCDYYQQNIEDDACTANAHGEVMTCAGFVAAMFSKRMQLAGYDGSPRSEVMAFAGNPAQAVAMWINSVYHRTPLVSPWIREMGYGSTADCDTVDLGLGPEVADDVTAVYPYPGQVDVPTEFDGSREGPMPPEPDSGWPSASPIHVYAKDYTVTTHEVFEGTSCDSLPHQWLPDDDYYIFYPDEPFKPSTLYRVRVEGTRGGQPLDFDWTFTTEN